MENMSVNKQYITFTLGNEIYGLDVMKVDSIERMSPITRVPKTEDFVLGVINLRGEIIPVIDTRKKVGLPPKPYDEQTRIIVAKNQDCSIGLIVDNVINVLDVNEDDVQWRAEIFEEKKKEFIAGILKRESGIILILDLDKLLSVQEIIQ